MNTTLITQSKKRATTDGVEQLVAACAAAVEKQEKISQRRQARVGRGHRTHRKVARYVYELKDGLIEWELSNSWKRKIAVTESVYARLRTHSSEQRRATRTLLNLPLFSELDVAIDAEDGDWLPEAARCGHRFLVCVLLARQNSYDIFEPELSPQQYVQVLDQHKEFHSTSRLQFLRNGLRTIKKHGYLSTAQLATVDAILSAPQVDFEEEIQKVREAMLALG